MIIIKDLYLYSQSRKKILLTIPEQVFDGDAVWFIQGASGTGKTILLQTISKHFLHYSGNIIIDDKAIEYYDRMSFAKKIQYMDQNYTLFEHMTIGEQLEHMLMQVSGLSASQSYDIVGYNLQAVGLALHRDKYPCQLSGGQKQRAALVQKIILNPDYLLLDEPTSALDYQSKILVLQYVSSFKDRGKKILLSTHDKDTFTFFEKKNICNIETIAKNA